MVVNVTGYDFIDLANQHTFWKANFPRRNDPITNASEKNPTSISTNDPKALPHIQGRSLSVGMLTRITRLLTTLGVMTHEQQTSGTAQCRTGYRRRISFLWRENYFVAVPLSTLACLKRCCSARFFSSRFCCALYACHCDCNSCRRRYARLPSKPPLAGIGSEGLLSMTASGSYRPDAHCGEYATVIAATTRTIKGVPSIRTLTRVGSECIPAAGRRASRLSGFGLSHPQLGQHSKKLGIIASHPKHFSSVGSSDIDHPQEMQFHSLSANKATFISR